MSTIIIRMPQHQVEELGQCMEAIARGAGRAMSIYEDMKHATGDDFQMNERYYPPYNMRDDWSGRGRDGGYDMDERRGRYRRY